MKKFIIDEAIFDLFPDAEFNILVLRGIDNTDRNHQQRQDLLDQGTQRAKQFLTEETFRLNPVVAQWREAFSQFKTKKGARCTIEAMLKRVNSDKTFSPINPLVDIYNAIALAYGIPGGGEDIDCLAGDLHLGMAKGGEEFLPLGAEESDPALEGEVIYYDQQGAVCRNFNWREAQRTMLTEATKNALLCYEAINQEQAARCQEAMAELKPLLEDFFGVDVILYRLNRDQREALLEK
ncbi:B3/B4 domain-containing protein [Facklamia hominis]|uniref:B3/B4 tRNA-binding domain-containing protein n=1 Tax=Facklamia hominis CCUG 36813 TaxID=883111 RepID=K1LAL0_9LACT|nr:phenylalanine--tRNA ligase beta subunit-related protein [Facklamia hominis]EKB53525.1 hypothetical protein HMPREF9706_01603 [Facklamia hominis CCUG 36813]EPH10810.1 hypothetical protein HMPREF9260_01012 [Facklamia hominis ACS-120-V-Sch10]